MIRPEKIFNRHLNNILKQQKYMKIYLAEKAVIYWEAGVEPGHGFTRIQSL